MANLEIRSVSKEFKTGKVLDRISLAADNGEIVAVFGPSGSGKTVLLRLIAGVEQPDEGSILLGGRDARRGDGLSKLRAFPSHVSVRQRCERADGP
jgi:ABC-type Fe3+/spermidine/putrescine transport system ATPase subunit